MTSVQSNAIVFLLGCLIFGCLSSFGGLALAKKAGVDPDDKIGDYESYEESPEQIMAPLTSTVMPYFDEKNKTIFSQKGGKVTLDCPAKNFNESHHQILWFKDGNTITNGKQSLTTAYQLDNDFNLTIEKVGETSFGDYYCSVFPQNVSRHVYLKLEQENIENPNTNNEVAGNNVPMIQAQASTLLMVVLIGCVLEAVMAAKIV